MKPAEIPDFIAEMLMQVELGIDQYTSNKLKGFPERTSIAKRYPDQLELQLNIEYYEEDGDYVDHQQCWVKIPWPKVIG